MYRLSMSRSTIEPISANPMRELRRLAIQGLVCEMRDSKPGFDREACAEAMVDTLIRMAVEVHRERR